MLLNLIQKKKLILAILSSILLLSVILTLVFGKGEDKAMVLVLSLILPLVFYGFLRFLVKIIRINASLKVITYFIYFFLGACTLLFVSDFVQFITAFPNGLNPSMGAMIGVIAACLNEAEKNVVN